jgi:hypothetical protein
MPTYNASTRPQAITALREMARALSAAWDLDTTLDLIARKTSQSTPIMRHKTRVSNGLLRLTKRRFPRCWPCRLPLSQM